VVYNCPVGSVSYSITSANQMTGLSLSNSLTMEGGYNGKILINPGHNSDFVYYINNPDLAASTIGSTGAGFFGSGQRIGSGFPDQVDGEDEQTYPCSTDGLTDLSTLSTVSVYPNPAAGVLFIEVMDNYAELLVEIADIQGKSVYSSILTGPVNTIDVSKLSKGIYTIKFNSGTDFLAKRIVISN
jgi:hypothetical protein